jgi:hypothetical protein
MRILAYYNKLFHAPEEDLVAARQSLGRSTEAVFLIQMDDVIAPRYIPPI